MDRRQPFSATQALGRERLILPEAVAEFDRGSVKSHETAAFTWAGVER
jgi:hypothetical protein